MRFKDKVVIVTGGGSGIGKATAMSFAAEGAHVVIGEIEKARLDGVVAELSGQGTQVLGVQSNTMSEEDNQRLVRETTERFGRIDVLVNNAGIMDRFLPVGELDNETWNRVLGVNLNGVMYSMRLVIPIMLQQGGGVIVNVASAAGQGGGYAGAAYTASKHAVVGLTRNTAVMYGKQGIRCVAIAPGAVETNIGMGGTAPSQHGYGALQMLMGGIPRVGKPQELAAAILFAASDEASFVNGAIIPVDGGWWAQG